MLRFLIATMPMAGHVNPGLPIARTLVERGHEVVWYTGRQFRAAVEATGARFAPIMAASEPEERSFDERFPESKKLHGLKALKFGLKYVFLDEAPKQVADMQRILQAFPADVVLGDTAFIGAGLLHELGGPCWATFGISALTLNSCDTAPFGTGLPPASSAMERRRNQVLNALTERVLFRDVVAHAHQVRASLGLPRARVGVLNSTLSPYLYLQSSTPAFEYPRSDLAPQVHFIGPLLPQPPMNFVQPVWWNDLLADRPVVLVTQGTIANDAHDLIVPTLRALADQDVLVITTTGGPSVDQIGIDPPANARIEPFVPYAALLSHVDVLITNGGFGGVQFALAHGVPLIVAGTTEEKPEIAARVAWSGAGINLKTKTPMPAQIRSAVQTVLAELRYRANAQRIQRDYAQHNAPQEAAALLERLAATKQPVLRDEVLARQIPLKVNNNHSPARHDSRGDNTYFS